MGATNAGLVLLVDGDANLRRAMRDFLLRSGCAVLEARDAYDALFICAQYGNAINLMVTEINLLPVGGIKLAENALRLWPNFKVLCTSVDTDMRGLQYWMNYLGAQYLPKPFTPAQLHARVFTMLGYRVAPGADPSMESGTLPINRPDEGSRAMPAFRPVHTGRPDDSGTLPTYDDGSATLPAFRPDETGTLPIHPSAPGTPVKAATHPPAFRARWDAFRPHADQSKPTSNTDDPLFWLKEF